MEAQSTSPVTVHPEYGPMLPGLGWVPSPSYLLRRHMVLREMASLPRGRVVEVGCGAGALLQELSVAGFDCVAMDRSESARRMASSMAGGRYPVVSDSSDAWCDSFDYLLALEVLEHIEDDLGALRQWRQWLRPQARVLVSVPAHERLWDASDVWAGHVRRYSRAGLAEVCDQAGFRVEKLCSYGFPLANLLKPLRRRAHEKSLRARQASGQSSQDENNLQSGTDRQSEQRLFPLLDSLPGRLAMKAGYAMQHLTRNTQWGPGFLALLSVAENHGGQSQDGA